MTKTLFKDALRSIAANKLRFISVIIIAALGISFFVGIKTASPAMRDKANEYFRENNLLDVRVTSPIAFSEDDINRISELDGVNTVVVSQYTDCFLIQDSNVLVDTNGSSLTCRIREFDFKVADKFTQTGEAENSYMNRLVLEDGRYPQKAGECVVDSRAAEIYPEMAIGKVITASGDEETISDSVSVTEFTIVGTVSSPMYISVDRGSTNIGTGALSTFIYASENTFLADEPNELFVRVNGSETYDKFSKTYESVVTNLSNTIQNMSVEIIDSKLAGLKADYAAKIAEKENEISEYQTESEKQLANKQTEIDEFKAYVDNEDKILATAQEDHDNELASAKSSLDSLQKQLSTLQTTYDADRKSFDNQSSEIKGYSELKSLYDELNAKHKTDSNNLDTLKNAVNTTKTQLNSKKADADGYKAAINTYDAQITSINSQISSNQSTLTSLKSQQSSLESQISTLNSEISDIQRNISDLETKAELTPAERINLTTYRRNLTTKQGSLSTANSELATVKNSITDTTNAISSLQSSLNSATANKNTATNSYNTAASEVNIATANYNNANSNYNSARASYDKDSATLANYIDSMKELTAGQTNLTQLNTKIADEEKRLNTLKISVTVAQIKYTLTDKNGTRDISKAQYDLSVAKTKYTTIDEEYTQLKDEIDTNTKNLNGDLRKLQKTLRNADSLKWETTPQTSITGHESYLQSMNNVHSMSSAFPMVFIITAMIACFAIMIRNVEEERRQIGVFKAVGYSDFSIITRYLLYTSFAWVIAAVIGVLIGSCLFPQAVYSIYSSVYNIPAIGPVFNPWYIGYGLVFSLCAMNFAIIGACVRVLAHSPASLMQPKNINYNLRTLLERFPSIWMRMSYGMIFVSRAIARSRRRVLAGLVGIACCTALILSAFGLANSAQSVTKSQYGKDGIFKYDVQFVLESGQKSDESDILNAVNSDVRTQSAMLMCTTTVGVSETEETAAINRSAHIIVPENLENISDYFNLSAVDGSITLEKGAVISQKCAQDLGINVGDTIVLTDKDTTVHQVQVAGIVKNYINNYIYMSPETYSSVFGEDATFSYLVCVLKDYVTDEDAEDFASLFLKNDDVTGAVTSNVMAKSTDSSIDRVLAVVAVFILSACILAAIVMYTISNISISERSKEIANIKVIGFTDSEVMLYVSRENIISIVIGIVFGLVGGFFFHRALIGFVSVDNVTYGNNIFWWSYILTVLIVAAVGVISSIPIAFRIKKIEMAETLKTEE